MDCVVLDIQFGLLVYLDISVFVEIGIHALVATMNGLQRNIS
jgi:hypothetical protein